MRRLTIALLGAWLVWTGAPALGSPAAASGNIAAAARHGADCRMACCKRVGAPVAAHTSRTGAAPASRAQALCRMGCGRGQQAGTAAPEMPWLLPLPARLPAPSRAAFAGHRPGVACGLPALDLPERPPRA